MDINLYIDISYATFCILKSHNTIIAGAVRQLSHFAKLVVVSNRPPDQLTGHVTPS